MECEKKLEIYASVKQKNPLATVLFTNFCESDVDEFFKHSTLLEQNTQFQDSEIVHVHANEKDEVSFVVLDYDENQEFDHFDLEKNQGKLIWQNEFGVEILRVKGIVKIKGENAAYSLQGVDETFELAESELLWENFDKKPYSKFQFIGRNIEGDKQKKFQVNGKA